MMQARREELKKINQTIEEWKLEIPEEFRRKARVRYLEERQKVLKRTYGYLLADEERAHPEFRYWLDVGYQKVSKELNKINLELKAIRNEIQGIDQTKIDRAKEYPITDLIDHSNYFARCPFHNEKTASLYLKNNFYHCFGCGANGDVIDYVMKTRNLTFTKTVELLAN